MTHVLCATTGLTEPMLIRLDVESKLSEQLKVRWGSSRGALCPLPPAAPCS